MTLLSSVLLAVAILVRIRHFICGTGVLKEHIGSLISEFRNARCIDGGNDIQITLHCERDTRKCRPDHR